MARVKHSIPWQLATTPEDATDRAEKALKALGATNVSKVDGSVGGTTPTSFRHNRWGADVAFQIDPDDDHTTCVVEISMSGGKHQSVAKQLLPFFSDVIVAAAPDAAGAVAAPSVPAPQPVERALNSISRKARGPLSRNITPGESVLFHLEGASHQTLVAMTDRVILVKPGYMAGATGGARVTSIPYRDVTGIEVNTGMTSAVLQVTSPSYPVARVDYWSGVGSKNSDANSPFVLPNCIPAPKRSIKSWEPYLARLRELVAEAKHPSGHVPAAVSAPKPSAADRLRELASLRDAGILSEDEFATKKAELLKEL